MTITTTIPRRDYEYWSTNSRKHVRISTDNERMIEICEIMNDLKKFISLMDYETHRRPVRQTIRITDIARILDIP